MACDEWRALAHLDPLQGWVGMMGEMGPGCANASLGAIFDVTEAHDNAGLKGG